MAAGAWTGSVTIYALCDPDSLAVRYVGKANDMRARIRSHKYEASCGRFHTRKANWLRSLNGREPVIMILAVVGFDQWEEAERYWIAEMRSRGCDLTNYADGGQTSPVEGKGHTDETKQKLRKAAATSGCKPPSRAGCKASDETRLKLSRASKERNAMPPKMGGWNKGILLTHCSNGHEYSDENTRICVRKDRDRQYQICKTCERARIERFKLKKERV